MTEHDPRLKASFKIAQSYGNLPPEKQPKAEQLFARIIQENPKNKNK